MARTGNTTDTGTMKPRYEGIIPPMVTPLRGRDLLDEAGLERLVEHILAGGVRGLFILGTTGEGPALGYALRRKLVTRVCRLVAGRVPIFAGITDTAFTEALGLAEHCADAGVTAVVAAPPYYLPAGQPELQEWLAHLAGELPLPLVLYNMPALTKVSFAPDTVRHAMEHPRIIGIKDSSGDLAYFRSLLALLPQRPDWFVLMGPEELLAESVAAGGHGGVNGGANLFPRLYTALFEAVRSGDHERAARLHERMLRVGSALYRIGSHSSAIIKGLKCALSCLGICDDFMAEPARRFRELERQKVAAAVERLRAELADLT